MFRRLTYRAALGTALAATLTTTVGGCTIRRDRGWEYQVRQNAYTSSSYRSYREADARPQLALSDAEVTAKLAKSRTRQQEAEARLRERQQTVVNQSLPRLADDLACSYATGAEEVAAELEGTHPRLVPFDRAGDLVDVSARYARWGRAGMLELTVSRRPGVLGAVAVAVPPGTLAEPDRGAPPFSAASTAAVGGERDWTGPDEERRFGHWPPAQDLALLRAPVILLGDGQQTATVTVPVACASFHLGGPEDGQPYVLQRIGQDGPMMRLLVQLCAEPVDDAEAQLAVWLCRDDISWEAFVAQGGDWGRLVTFQGQQPVLPRHADGAARVLLEAGLDPRPLRFFGGEGGGQNMLAPLEVEAEPEPAPEPEQPEELTPPTPPVPADLSA